MSSLKRVPDSRSRGHSPPEKRSRQDKSSVLMHNKSANTNGRSTTPNPLSRKNSAAPNIDSRPDGLAQNSRDRLKLDTQISHVNGDASNRRPPQHEEQGDSHTGLAGLTRSIEGTSPYQIMSPASTGSRASTPVNIAPQAPSMLPKSASASASENVAPTPTQTVQSPATVPAPAQGGPKRLAQIRQRKMMKQKEDQPQPTPSNNTHHSVISKPVTTPNTPGPTEPAAIPRAQPETTSSNTIDAALFSQLQTQSTAQQKQITQLKEERDAMSDRLAKLEAQLSAFMNGSEKTKLDATCTTPSAARPSGDDPDIKRQVREIENRLAQRVKDNEKSLLSRLQSLETSRDRFDAQNLAPRFSQIADEVEVVTKREDKTYRKTEQLRHDLDRYEVRTETRFKKTEQLRHDLDRYEVRTETRFKKNETDIHDCILHQTRQRQDAEQARALQSYVQKIVNTQTMVVADQAEVLTRLGGLESKVADLVQRVNNMAATVSKSESHDHRLKIIEDSNAIEQQISSKLEPFEHRLDAFKERISSRLEPCEQGLATMTEGQTNLDKRLSDLIESQAAQSSPSTIAALETRVSALETRHPAGSEINLSPSGTDNELEEFIQMISEALEIAERDVSDLKRDLKTVHDFIPKLFDEKFGPLKEQIISLKKELNSTVDDHQQRLEILDAEMNNLKLSSAQAQQLNQVQNPPTPNQDLLHLQANLRQETESRQHEMRELDSRIALKADNTTMVEQLNRFAHSFRSLEERYNNIYTDDLYQKMTHWILQNFPNNSDPGLLHQVSAIQHELRELQHSTNHLRQIGSASLQRLPQVFATIDGSAQTAKDAKDESANMTSLLRDHMKITTKLQKDVDDLSSDASPFVRKENILEHVQKAVAQESQGRNESIGQLETSISADHERLVQRVDPLERSIKGFSEDLSRLSTQLIVVRDATNDVRQMVDKINSDYILPNKAFFFMMVPAIVTVSELQSALDKIDAFMRLQNKGRERLDLSKHFTYDIQRMLKHASASLENENGHQSGSNTDS